MLRKSWKSLTREKINKSNEQRMEKLRKLKNQHKRSNVQLMGVPDKSTAETVGRGNPGDKARTYLRNQRPES